MDDLQFRRAIYADPNNQDAEVTLAQQKDASKKQFAQEMNQLDEKIKQALQVPVPDHLCDKLILRQTLANHQVQKRKTRVYLALAASVAIVAALLVNFMQFSSAYNNLGDYALAHVYHEQDKFTNNDSNTVTLASLNQKMTAFDGNFSESLGKLLFADYCRFGGLKSLHLVYQGKTSPVTIFVVPKNEQLAFTTAFNDQQLFGSSIEFTNSNIIVVADKNESLAQWQQHINKTVSWSI
ncbi:DUF3379 family protein [Colwellia ponticola]|uniref:DUF3379 domain-containing protein n=1 Tax=Colwellia ponticola TaxID=2304625 RepID=A0A8H2JMF1_9GAMM|nr:DUF3379 family protein [Colwellia ponticola]TMM44790.1 DUF3379 domain-containing protein [Colwellia ponticola]